MPTYEYACRQCGEHLEVVQSFHDESLTECPQCQGSLRKVFGSIGITFKGSGFYKTDSRSSSSAVKPPASGSDSGSSDSGSAGKSDGSGSSGSDSSASKSESTKSEPSKSDSGKSDSGSAAKTA